MVDSTSSLDDVIATRDISKFVGLILESFGGNTSAGADFLREAVKRMDINGDDGGASGEEEASASGGEAAATTVQENHEEKQATRSPIRGEGEGEGGGRVTATGEEGSDGEDEEAALANQTKRVAESDLDGPRAKAARTAAGLIKKEGREVINVKDEDRNGLDQSYLQGDAADETPFTVVILVPDTPAVIADIIGKSGSHVLDTQKRSGAQIQIDKVVNRGRERKIAITGMIKAIMLAQQIISKRVRDKEDDLGGSNPGSIAWKDSNGHYKLKVLVPNSTVRHLIGRSGCVVTQLEKDSGAQLKFQHEAEMDPLAIGRLLEILGSPAHQNVALYQILRKLADEKTLPSHWRTGNVFEAQQKIIQSATPYPPPQGGAGQYQNGGGYAGMGGGGGSITSLGLGGVGGGGGSGRMHSPVMKGPGGGGTLVPPQAPQQQAAQASAYPGYPGYASNPDMYSQGGQAATLAVPLNRAPGSVVNRNAGGYAGGGGGYVSTPSPQPQADMHVSSSMTADGFTAVTVAVPDKSVRFLIGKQGSNVQDLEKQSGCRVEFAKMAAPGSIERYVTIKGTQDAVHIGTNILQARVTEWQTSPTISRN